MIYLITFCCYGRHLHGEEAGSVDRGHNLFGGRVITPDSKRVTAEHERMDQPAYELDSRGRSVVLASLRERCAERRWHLLAAHVRTTHVHFVVEGEARPERIMNDVKSCASRCLNLSGLDQSERKRWARHGSTRWLWSPESVATAIRYVVDSQGERMAVFEE